MTETIAAKVDRVLELLGAENDARTGGQGMLGRLARIEHKLETYDRMRARVSGAMGAAGALILALWYILRDRIDHFLGRGA